MFYVDKEKKLSKTVLLLLLLLLLHCMLKKCTKPIAITTHLLIFIAKNACFVAVA